MITKKLELIDEQTSPLFRILWAFNSDEPVKRQFGNNICAFHIGNGFILTVAHNLRTEAGAIHSMEEEIYQREIYPKLNPAQKQVYDQWYPFDAASNKRYLHITDPNSSKTIVETFRQINFDTRWQTLVEKKICRPNLIVQFRDNLFYSDASLTRNNFNSSTYFHEPSLNRHTFILGLEFVKAFYSDDIALYRIASTSPDIIAKLPYVPVDYSMLDDNESNLYCLQSSSGSSLGRLLNIAKIEGYADSWSMFADRIGGNYIMDGTRYLIRGYFRFGSSGAPYIVYHEHERQFKVNAIQSEASGIQLSINNSREGNFQYVNAIASPLKNIMTELKRCMEKEA
jgi:hypothetical protein